MDSSPLHRHFDLLFRYDAWANRTVADALTAAGPPDAAPLPDAARLFAHLTSAAEVWLKRVQDTDHAGLPIWPDDVDVVTSASRGARAAAGWRALLRATTEADLDREIRYTNSHGEPFTTPLAEIAAHVVNHGSHHRGQIARLLREAGRTPPALDLIVYVRSPERDA